MSILAIVPGIIRASLCAILILVAGAAFAENNTACPPVAEQPTAEMVKAAARHARDHGFLWRISKDGHTSYLYGTMHVGKLQWAVPGPTVTQALRTSDTIALELDMLDEGMRDRIAQGVAALRMTALPDALEKRMRRQAEAACVPYASLARLSPEFKITTLILQDGRRDGLDAEYATDGVLAGIGHGARKNMVSLETPEAQLQLLQMKDEKETVAFVEENLDEIETGRSRTLLKRIAEVWSTANYTEMEHYSEWCDCLNTENERALMKRILDDRNPGLAERIDALHASGKRVFAAVGSLHMFGPLGLPLLMSKRGYRVDRVEFNPR
jgi:uncharacterized protein YbaP (TraB family)